MLVSDVPMAMLEKIRSEDLRDQAVTADPQPHVVIVELDLPHPEVDTILPDKRAPSGRFQFRFNPASENTSEIDRRVTESSREIEKIVGKPPERFFSTSQSF